MLQLPASARAWGTPDFDAIFTAELQAAAPNLPLDAAATPGCHVEQSTITVTRLSAVEQADGLRIRVGVFFSEVVASCGCGDDPFSQPGYCELRIAIDRVTAVATVDLMQT